MENALLDLSDLKKSNQN